MVVCPCSAATRSRGRRSAEPPHESTPESPMLPRRTAEWERDARARKGRDLTPADFAAETAGFWREYDMEEFAFARCDIPRVEAPNAETFARDFGRPNLPVIITGVASSWPALERWTWAALRRRFGRERVLLGKASSGSAPTTIDEFAAYAASNNEMNPRYVFDAEFEAAHPEMASEYMLPPYLSQNMFDRVPPRYRPPLEWLLLGPKRSGTFWHTDPYNTSAWNALLEGRKLWALFPRTVYAPPGVYASELPQHTVKYCSRDECRLQSAMEWIRKTLPYLAEHARPQLCVQQPGEIIFVPHGWWHMVLNLDDTVALTKNFIDENNYREMLASMLAAAEKNRGYAEVAAAFVDRWKGDRPELFTAADLRMAAEVRYEE
eukprot:a845885_49.p1 GENE.a845885_49~~a845885_49.p1  ORF type:complete len:413 (+),score=118.15 a845885_49:106-1239(+)